MKIQKLHTLLVLALLAIGLHAHAQDTDSTRQNRRGPAPRTEGEKPPFLERVRFGGNFSLQLGTNTFIDISPFAAYQLTDQLQLGAGITYQYFRFRPFNPFTGQLGNTLSNSLYGGRVFTRFFPLPQFFAQAEYESLNTAYWDVLTSEVRRDWIPGAFIGGGYHQGVGRRNSGFMFTVLYNLLYDQYRTRSPYGSPWVIRAGFQI